MKNSFLLLLICVSVNAFVNAQSLDKLKELAANNNSSLQATYKRFEAALERVVEVSDIPDPNLSLGYFIAPVETRVGAQKMKLSLSEMFPWFGTLKAKKQEATYAADVAYQGFIEAKNQLFFKVASAYYPRVELEQLMALELKNIQILSSYKEIAQMKFQNGKGAMVDVLRAEMMLQDAQTNIQILENKKTPLDATLNALLNRPLDTKITFENVDFNPNLSETIELETSVLSNPLLEAADLKIKAAKVRETIAIKQGLPKLGLGIDYVFIEERADATLADNGKNALMPMLSMSLPIFRAKHQAAKREALLKTEAYHLERQALEYNLEASLEMALFQLKQQNDLMELYKNQIQTTQQSLRLLYTSYGNSGSGFEEVLRMQQQELTYEKLRITTSTQYLLSVEKIAYLTSQNTNAN